LRLQLSATAKRNANEHRIDRVGDKLESIYLELIES